MDETNQSPLACAKNRPRNRFWKTAVWLAVGLFGVIVTGLIFMPSVEFNSTGAGASLVKCASNLQQIGLAIRLYANDNKGQYPDTFTTLLANEDITPAVFVCPSSDDSTAGGPTTQATLDDLTSGGHLSYLYVGRGLTTSTATSNTVVAYESLANHHDKINVLFGDGHVEGFTNPVAMRLIAEASAGERPVTMPSTP
jgi:prepilin-type processing-associated H-X9-DG protein